MFNGKMKAVTFSFDDGVQQDKRLMEIFDKYGLKCTFNFNSGRFGVQGIWQGVDHTKFKREEMVEVYSGHEIAGHTVSHPTLTLIEDDDKVIWEVEHDRKTLSEVMGYEVIGMAYPNGGVNNDDRVEALIRNNTGIKYARTITSSHSFDLQTNLLRFNPTVAATEYDKLFSLGEEFIKLNPETPKLFYIWGHSYSFDVDDSWDKFEEFCKMISGREDIFYGTNREVFGL
ncbi:MAG: polysaccharide deacetylase family protein [Acutalibacteraceae bacterium]|nr:polysaccharide deacetylase family protein [Acutalibacteraceae bacterium]